jgi:predicted RNase H-like nuclease (RuvC/YqgF family)
MVITLLAWLTARTRAGSRISSGPDTEPRQLRRIREDIANPKNLYVAYLTAPLVKAVQELKAENDDLRASNDYQQQEIEELREQIAALRQGK